MGSLIETLVSDLMTNPDASIRVQAAYDIGEYHFTQAIDYLKEALWKDSESLVKIACMLSLHKLEGDDVADEIIKVYQKQTDSMVRFYAIDILSKINNKKAVEELRNALKNEKDEKILELVVYSLAKKKDKAVKKEIVRLLEKKDVSPRIKERAVEYFIYTKDKDVVNKIEPFIVHEYLPLKAKVIFYLAITGNKEKRKLLEEQQLDLPKEITLSINGKVYRGTEGFVEALKNF